MLKNPYLRLLMTTVTIQRLTPLLDETLESIWMIPPEVTSDQLKEFTDLINAAEFSPPIFEHGGAEDQIRRKTNRTRSALASSDEEDVLEGLFPAGGPTNRKAIDGEKKKTKRRKRRSQSPDEVEPDERARKRREREREKRAKVKSQVYVYDSDPDSEADREFFAREEELRRSMQQAAAEVGQSIPGIIPAGKRKIIGDSGDEIRRDLALNWDSSSAEETGSETEGRGSGQDMGRKRRRVSEDSGAAGDDDDLVWPSRAETLEDRVDVDGDVGMENADAESSGEDEDEDEPVRSSRARPRVRGGFVMDSSDEE